MRWVLVLAVVLVMGCPRQEEPPGGGGGQPAPVAAPDPARYHRGVARAAGAASMLVDALQRGNHDGALRYLGQARTQLYEAERYASDGDRTALIEAQDQAIMVQTRLANRAAATAAAQDLLARLSAIQAAYGVPPPRPRPVITPAPAAGGFPVHPRASATATARKPVEARTVPAGKTAARPAPRPVATLRMPDEPKGWSGMVPQPKFAPSTRP